MEQSTLASYQWTEGGIFIKKIEDVLSAGRLADTPPLEAWRARALMQARHVRAASTLARSTVILSEAPFATMDNLLLEAEHGATENLSRIRAGRKLFHIARDGIILSTHPHSTPQFESLRRLCRNLGVYADSYGEDVEAACDAREALTELRIAPHESFRALHGSDLLIEKVDRALHASTAITAGIPDDMTYDAYHRIRKDFRRVSNVLALHAAHVDTPAATQLAAEGMQLNRRLGHMADTLDKSV